MSYWAGLKGPWGDFSRAIAVEIKYQAKQAGKSVVQAGKNAATSVWDNRDAIAMGIIAAGSNILEEVRLRQEQMQQEAQHQPPSNRQNGKHYGLDDYDEPTVVLDWQKLPNGLKSDLSGYKDKVGLYRMKNETGEVVYVGRAVEHDNGGLRKRLRDYTRESDTGRRHQSGQQIYANRENLTVEVLVVGNDAAAAALVKQFEPDAIREDNPLWNKHYLKKNG